MQSTLVQAGWTLAVGLGLYGFYCHWEAGRADLAAVRSPAHTSRGPALPLEAGRYRARCRWALLGCSLLAALGIFSAF